MTDDADALPAEGPELAQHLFIHGLLRATKQASIDALVASAINRTRPRRRTALWSATAAALLIAVTILYLTGDHLPSAEAAVATAEKALDRDHHYAGTMYVNGAVVRTANWWIRADRWIVNVSPVWIGGDGGRIWMKGPLGRVIELQRDSDLPDLDPTLLQANLRDALAELRTSFDLQMIGREKAGLHVRGTRRGTGRGARTIDVWIDEKAGRTARAELDFEHRRHVLEFRDAEPHPDSFYLPAAH